MTLKRSVALSLALGAVCFGFRLAVWQAAYDPDTQLITDAGLVLLSNLFFCLCLLVIGLLFALRHPRDAAARRPIPVRRPSGVCCVWRQFAVPSSPVCCCFGSSRRFPQSLTSP